MEIGPLDHVTFSKAVLGMGFHKYPGYSFDFHSGCVVYQKLKPASKRIINGLFTYQGQINKQKYISNMSSLCRSLSHDCERFADLIQDLSQDLGNENKEVKVTGPPDTGLAGQSVRWATSEIPEGGLVDLSINLYNLSDLYKQLSHEIPLVVNEFRSVGLENFFFPVWDYVSRGFYKNAFETCRISHSDIRGLRSVTTHGRLIDYSTFDTDTPILKLVETMRSARKELLLRFAARSNEYHQRMLLTTLRLPSTTFDSTPGNSSMLRRVPLLFLLIYTYTSVKRDPMWKLYLLLDVLLCLSP